jgi:hypothetical protein
MADIRYILEHIRATYRLEKVTYSFPTVTEVKARATSSEKDTIRTIAQANSNFPVTPNMLQMDEMVAQTPLKDLKQVKLVLERIPRNSLYKLQVSVASELQSHARTDAIDLQHTKNGKEVLELVFS